MFAPRKKNEGDEFSINCGLIVIVNEDRTTSVINTSGETVLKLERDENKGYAKLSNYSENLAKVVLGGKTYYIDKKGRRMGDPDFGKEN